MMNNHTESGLRPDDPRKDCPFCGCKGEDLRTDQLGIVHECCGFVEWNEWNTRPEEDRLRRRVEELEKALERAREATHRMGFLEGADGSIRTMQSDKYWMMRAALSPSTPARPANETEEEGK